MAAERYNGARVLLQQRTDAARSASRQASAAGRTAQAASDKVGQLAAAGVHARQAGASAGWRPILSSNGPQEVIDRASGMAVVSDLRTQVLAGGLGHLRRRRRPAAAGGPGPGPAARPRPRRPRPPAPRPRPWQTRRRPQTVGDPAAAGPARGPAGHAAAHLRRPRGPAPGRAEGRGRGPRRGGGQGERRAPGRGRRPAGRPPGRRRPARRRPGRRPPARPPRAELTAAAPAPAGPGPGGPAGAGRRRARPPRRRSTRRRADSGGVGAVLAYAQAQIGEPYVWGAEGPGSWDCSGPDHEGVAAGRRLPLALHRLRSGPRPGTCPSRQRQPGDLIFYGVSGAASHHVGLYVGGDQMIEAPHTGANVRYRQHLAAGHHHGGRPALSGRPTPDMPRGAPPRRCGGAPLASVRGRRAGPCPGARPVSVGGVSARASGPSSSRRPWPAGGSSGSPPRPRSRPPQWAPSTDLPGSRSL